MTGESWLSAVADFVYWGKSHFIAGKGEQGNGELANQRAIGGPCRGNLTWRRARNQRTWGIGAMGDGKLLRQRQGSPECSEVPMKYGVCL